LGFKTDRTRSGPVLIRFALPVPLLAIAFSRKCRFYALLLARLQIESVPLNVFDDVLLQNFAFEASQRAFQAFAFMNLNLSHVFLIFRIRVRPPQSSRLRPKGFFLQRSPHQEEQSRESWCAAPMTK
jgi:hypothetical protein